jgi:23S rRNA pseudouridine1911/1915/1917 synthase
MRRHFTITRADARRTVAEFLHHRLGLTWSAARQLVRAGHVWVEQVPCHDSTRRLQKGQQLLVEMDGGRKASGGRQPPVKKRGADAPRSPGQRTRGIVIRHADEHVVVVDKPADLTTMRHAHEAAEFGKRARKYLPDTLENLLPRLLPRQGGKPPRVVAVHRLDKETSGLVVFARTPEAARHLGRQMRTHSAERCYLALVRGEAKDATIESWLVRDRGDGRRGSGKPEEGQRAVTHAKVLERLGEFSLVECRLETGRTHQVRIHLGEAGTPICGERIYDRPLNGSPVPDTSGAHRIALHAASLEFEHPATGKRMQFTSRLPGDMKQLLQSLRQS